MGRDTTWKIKLNTLCTTEVEHIAGNAARRAADNGPYCGKWDRIRCG